MHSLALFIFYTLAAAAAAAANIHELADGIKGWSYPGPKAVDNSTAAPSNKFSIVQLDLDILVENRQHMYDYDHGMQHALWYLQKTADRFVRNDTTLTVTNKSLTAPSHDKHDYVSLAKEYWPNGNGSGLPYVYKNAENPEAGSVRDYALFRDLVKQTRFLSLAYYYFANETFAAKAVQRLEEWFTDPETRMNPNLQYANLIRGYNTGLARGIVEFDEISDLLDFVVILQDSSSWPKEMNAQLRSWFSLYLQWLTQSPNGQYLDSQQEAHGTRYHVQQLALYRFLNITDKSAQLARNVSTMIDQQLLSTGQQFHETVQADAWSGSVDNLRSLFRLARMAHLDGVDLYSYQSQDGKSLRKALDYLVGYAQNTSSWPFNSTMADKSKALTNLVEILEYAYVAYDDLHYKTVRDRLADQYARPYNITRLMLPWYAFGTNPEKDPKRENSAGSPYGVSPIIAI
ncbi:hypothetical protein DFQ28_003570 [Apophysomyces sp. BC1034]|nr:hypothetical protein DFQ28_003570 [Apophysomyces sp. BC1034]